MIWPLLAAVAIAGEPGTLYVAVQEPFGVGWSSLEGWVVTTNLVPLALEARVDPRWGVRLAGGTLVVFTERSGRLPDLVGTHVRIEVPRYFGRGAPADGIVGAYVGPFVSLHAAASPGGGASLGYSGRLAGPFRGRAGVMLGWTFDPRDTRGGYLQEHLVLEIGAIAF